MKIVDKDPPSKEVQDVAERFKDFIERVDFDNFSEVMASDQTPKGRCFVAGMMRELNPVAAAMMFERRG